MANLLAVLDSCVLYPMYLRDTLLRMAEMELYRVYWSQEILLGATRNLIAGGRITSDKALRLQTLISKAFPEAMIEVPEDLVEKMNNHPGDRHVLATAVVAQANIIVTYNLKHFPNDVLNCLDIEAQHPDIFLTRLFDIDPNLVTKVVRQQAQDLQRPPTTIDELLNILSKQVPIFASKVKNHLLS